MAQSQVRTSTTRPHQQTSSSAVIRRGSFTSEQAAGSAASLEINRFTFQAWPALVVGEGGDLSSFPLSRAADVFFHPH